MVESRYESIWNLPAPEPETMSWGRRLQANLHTFFCVKARDVIRVESLFEADAACLKTVDPNIVRILAQPQTIHLTQPNGRRYKRKLDFWLRYRDGSSCYVEQRPKVRMTLMDDGSYRPEGWADLENWAREHQQHVDSLHEGDVYANLVRVANARKATVLASWGFRDPSEEIKRQLLDRLRYCERTTIGALLEVLRRHEPARVEAALAYLHCIGELFVDLDTRRWDRDTTVEHVHGKA